MFLEERVRTLEERIATMEAAGNHRLEAEISGRLADLEEKGNRLAGRTHGLETRLEELAQAQSPSELLERVDQCESTCSDLIETDDNLRKRHDGFEQRLTAFQRQLEGFLEQLAELDGRQNGSDQLSAHDERLRKVEHQLGELQSLRNLRKEVSDRLEHVDRSVSQHRSRLESAESSIESLRNKSIDLSPITKRLDLAETTLSHVDELTDGMAALEGLCSSLDRENLPLRLRNIEERLSSTDSTSRVSGMMNRLEGVERDAGDLRKEVSWLRDRPQRPQGDGWSRALGLAGMALGIAAIVLFFWPKTTLTAERFKLLAKDGRVLGDWSQNGQGAALQLNGAGGEPRLMLSGTGPNSLLSLADQSGSERVRLATDPAAGNGLLICDAIGQGRLWCGVTHRPALSLFDSEGNVRGAMTLEPGGAELAFMESNQQPRVRLTTTPGDNGLRVYDNNGRLRLGAGMCPEGAAVNLFDPNQHRRVVLSSGSAGAALAFMGESEVQRTTLGMTEKDESILNLHDREGRQRVLLFASTDDAGLQVMDRQTKLLFSEP